MRQETTCTSTGANIGSLLPAAINLPSTQNRDVLEVTDRPLWEDGMLTSFTIKALLFFISLVNAIRRFSEIRHRLDTLLNDLFDENDIDPGQQMVREICSRQREELHPFHNSLTCYYHSCQEAIALYCRLLFRHAVADTPTQAEALHGASCNSIFCTYVI